MTTSSLSKDNNKNEKIGSAAQVSALAAPQKLEFPRGNTVPFPYEKPYPQQTALMDTLLQCLQQKEEEKEKGQLRLLEEKNDNCSSNTKKQQKRRAAVMMLESPTGTGKSLSLACSAMAWLKYCEQRDLQLQIAAVKKNTEEAKQPGPAGDDWWNAWVPPEESQREQEIQTTVSIAKQARQQLGEELEMWRSKIYGDVPDAERANQRRANFVRSAVTTAKMAEKIDSKRRRETNKKKKKVFQQQREEDFCVTDYKSDDPEDATWNDSDSEEEATGNTQHGNNPPLGKATTLLDGHRLDGSHRDKGPPLSDYTVGQPDIVAGTGVRKIIYAARTHSQLSQFVGELKRTAWGADTRVVALGSRQLLCGNMALKKAHPTEASLTEACLDLKQGGAGSKAKDGNKKRGQDGIQKSSCGCSLLESNEAVSTLGLHMLTTPSDIEDAARLGSASHTCAYYASRVRFYPMPSSCIIRL